MEQTEASLISHRSTFAGWMKSYADAMIITYSENWDWYQQIWWYWYDGN